MKISQYYTEVAALESKSSGAPAGADRLILGTVLRIRMCSQLNSIQFNLNHRLHDRFVLIGLCCLYGRM